MLLLNALLCLLALTDVAHCAHLLGKHSDPSGGAALTGRFPHPLILYHHFIEPGKPMLMKNILEQTEHTAFMNWDDDYLEENYGDVFVRIWAGSPPERIGLKLSQFLMEYQKIPITVSDYVPEQMKADFLVPPALQCGGIQDNLHRPGLYFSDGGDRTLLHRNDVDYISCLLDGHQELVLYDKDQKEQVEAVGWVEDEEYSQVDTQSIDYEQYPDLFYAPWRQVNVSKGDCVFIPYGWYQYMSSDRGRTLAVTMKFSHLWWFNKMDCDGIDKDTPLKPMSHFSTLHDFGDLRTPLLAAFANKSLVSRELFSKKINCGSEELTEQFWEYIDKNDDGSLSWQELYGFDMNYEKNKFYRCYKKYWQHEKDNVIIPRDKADDTFEREVKVESKKKKKSKLKVDEIEVKDKPKVKVSEDTEPVTVTIATSEDSDGEIDDNTKETDVKSKQKPHEEL